MIWSKSNGVDAKSSVTDSNLSTNTLLYVCDTLHMVCELFVIVTSSCALLVVPENTSGDAVE